MTGLRARQKATRNRRIVEAASRLFRDVGYDHARIEDIAGTAEISVGTFYNYFQNKGDILVAIVSLEVEEVLDSGADIVASPPTDVLEALQALVAAYYDHALVYLSKAMWRLAMALTLQQPEAPASRRYAALDGRLRDQVTALVETLQTQGRVRADIDAGAVGQMVFNNLNMMFMDYIREEAMPLDSLKQAVRRQNAPLAGLIAAP